MVLYAKDRLIFLANKDLIMCKIYCTLFDDNTFSVSDSEVVSNEGIKCRHEPLIELSEEEQAEALKYFNIRYGSHIPVSMTVFEWGNFNGSIADDFEKLSSF